MENTINGFQTFGKISRLSRDAVVSEKLDGSNGQVFIWDGESIIEPGIPWIRGSNGPGLWIAAGSRNRWVTPDNDNFGFARWVQANVEELFKLGPGRHFGEWWGAGINRGYGLTEKRFSLFNVDRWGCPGSCTGAQEACPNCCHIVPVLYRGMFNTELIDDTLVELAENGSKAAPGYLRPEGIVIYHTASRTRFKKTILHDDAPKGQIS